MKLTAFFLRHPVAAIILNSMIAIIGLLCFQSISIREYPEISFSQITVDTSFPNANAELVEKAITNILEERLGGIEGLDTVISESRNGQSLIQLQFRQGISIDRALNAVRDAVHLSKDLLPTEVKDPLVLRKQLSETLPPIILSLNSPTMNEPDLTHFANIYLKNSFKSIGGISSVGILGPPYTYKIVLDPQKMYSFGVNADDIIKALKKSNLSLPTGKFQNQIPSSIYTDLKDVSDYKHLLVKERNSSNPAHIKNAIFLSDISTISFIGDDQNYRVRINGKPSVCIIVNRMQDANPLEVSRLVHEKIKELKSEISSDVKLEVLSDQSHYMKDSLQNVKKALLEAIILVIVVVFIFLRNIKATLIPIITIPISIVGSFIIFKLFGLSINIMTLMALVLAIGLVVDDAIVVLENIQRHINNGMPSYDAALKGAQEIGFAIIAMTLTSTSVFVPLLFITGEIAPLFREFAVALVGSVLISGIVALTLSPLMCYKVLHFKQTHWLPSIDVFLLKLSQQYKKTLLAFIDRKKTCFTIIAVLFVAIFLLSSILPREMAPSEDRGMIGVYINPNPSEDINALNQNMLKVEKVLKEVPEAQNQLVLIQPTGANIILPLSPISLRTRKASEIINIIEPLVSKIPTIDAHPWNWDMGLPVSESNFNNNQLTFTISTSLSYQQLYKHAERISSLLEKNKMFTRVRHNLKMDNLEYQIFLNTNEMAQLNLTPEQIAKTIEIFFSGDKSIPFSKDGIIYYLTIQAEHSPHSLNELYITNPIGKHISLGVIAKMKETSELLFMPHYNQLRSTQLTLSLAPNVKMDKAIKEVSSILKQQLPPSYKMTWTGAAKEFLTSETTMLQLFMLALLFIFAVLAIQFENFIDPLIILTTVPLACASALFFIWLFGQSLNIYTQVGLITLVGLISKHGILIVEFANELKKTSSLTFLATISKASALRLTPILMTTAVMIFGSVPLLLSNEAGSEARKTIGIVLIGGLSAGTIFTLYLLPVVYLMIKNTKRKPRK